MQLSCPACGRVLPVEDVNINTGLAKCTQCNSIFNFSQQVASTGIAAATKSEKKVPRPERFQVEDLGSELTIRWSWYSPQLWFMFFFCIFWDGFLIVWYSIFLFGSFFNNKGMGWFTLFPLLFPLLHVAVGVGLTYGVLAGFLNRTVVSLRQGELSIWSGPLPTWGNKVVSTFEISQLFVSEETSYRRRGVRISFDLNMVSNDGTKKKLLHNIENYGEALFLEQSLESHLHLIDEPVPGEAKPT